MLVKKKVKDLSESLFSRCGAGSRNGKEDAFGKNQIRAKGLKFFKGPIAGFDGFFQVPLSMSQR
jgi:hypothetical protein